MFEHFGLNPAASSHFPDESQGVSFRVYAFLFLMLNASNICAFPKLNEQGRITWERRTYADIVRLTEADLCPTIGICILGSLMFPKAPAGHLTFALSNLQYGIPFTDHFQIHTVELPK